jgi:hypothetical protein
MTGWIVVALTALLAANAAHAGNVVVKRQETSTSPAVVSVTGRIDNGDYAAFIAITQRMKHARPMQSNIAQNRALYSKERLELPI